jgi:hypothetical protein
MGRQNGTPEPDNESHMTNHGEILVYQTEQGELDPGATSEDFWIVRIDGQCSDLSTPESWKSSI